MTNAVNNAKISKTKNILAVAVADYEDALVTLIANELSLSSDEAKTKFAGFLGVDESQIVNDLVTVGQYKVVFGADNHIVYASFWLNEVIFTYNVNEKSWTESS
jgi:hypothetical protein